MCASIRAGASPELAKTRDQAVAAPLATPPKSRIEAAKDALVRVSAGALELAKKPDAWMVGAHLAIAGGYAAAGVAGASAALGVVGAALAVGTVWVGYQVADAFSYGIHCYLDQADPAKHPAWMRPVIIDFQHHHDKPNDIRVASFLYNARFVAIPFIPAAIGIALLGPGSIFAAGFAGLMLGALATQEMHKLAHTPDEELPPVKRFILTKVMRPLKLALRSQAHGKHHKSPRNTNYAVCTGVNNWWMDKLNIGDGIIALMRSADKLYDGGTPRWEIEEKERMERRGAHKLLKAAETRRAARPHEVEDKRA